MNCCCNAFCVVTATIDEQRVHARSTGAGHVMFGVVTDKQALFGTHPKLNGERAERS